MRRTGLFVVSILSLVTLSAVPARAQSAGLLFGQKHFYSVTFRANGEAIVYARVVVSNTTASPLDKLEFTTGSDALSELSAIQMILPKQCEKYATAVIYSSTMACEKYGEPDYTTTYAYNPDGEQTKYYRLDTETKENAFSVKLHDAIAPDKSGAVILAYVSKNYVKSGAFGTKRYDFRTLGASSRQGETTIGISLDSGLTFKDSPDREQCCMYPAMDARAGIAEVSVSTSGPVESKTLDSTIAGIGYGEKNEKASGVGPGEQFSVKGAYATSRIRLYWPELLAAILIPIALLAAVLLFVFVAVKKIRKKAKK